MRRAEAVFRRDAVATLLEDLEHRTLSAESSLSKLGRAAVPLALARASCASAMHSGRRACVRDRSLALVAGRVQNRRRAAIAFRRDDRHAPRDRRNCLSAQAAHRHGIHGDSVSTVEDRDHTRLESTSVKAKSTSIP